MGFTLRITNPPSGATRWHADFAARTWDYDPIADSGWLGIAEVWDYPSDPRGATTLAIIIIDAQNNVLLNVSNLGPVNDGQDYEFNASTRKLTVIAVEPPPVFHLAFIDSIFSFVWDIADWFLSAYREVSGWIWPFYYLQYPLYGLWSVTRSLLTPIAHFGEWADDVWAKVQQIFSFDQIVVYFRTWIDYATTAWDWVRDSFWNVWHIVDSWWSSTKATVQGWIAIATEGFNALIVWWDEFWKITWPGWVATLEVLGSEVSHFFTQTLPGLYDDLKLENWWNGKLFAIDGLIGSKLAEWFPFYDDVAEFFKDPGEFLLSRLTDWFLGKEE